MRLNCTPEEAHWEVLGAGFHAAGAQLSIWAEHVKTHQVPGWHMSMRILQGGKGPATARSFQGCGLTLCHAQKHGARWNTCASNHTCTS